MSVSLKDVWCNILLLCGAITKLLRKCCRKVMECEKYYDAMLVTETTSIKIKGQRKKIWFKVSRSARWAAAKESDLEQLRNLRSLFVCFEVASSFKANIAKSYSLRPTKLDLLGNCVFLHEKIDIFACIFSQQFLHQVLYSMRSLSWCKKFR